jgi:hypothetical protein
VLSINLWVEMNTNRPVLAGDCLLNPRPARAARGLPLAGVEVIGAKRLPKLHQRLFQVL